MNAIDHGQTSFRNFASALPPQAPNQRGQTVDLNNSAFATMLQNTFAMPNVLEKLQNLDLDGQVELFRTDSGAIHIQFNDGEAGAASSAVLSMGSAGINDSTNLLLVDGQVAHNHIEAGSTSQDMHTLHTHDGNVGVTPQGTLITE
jgi:hypothetical protein